MTERKGAKESAGTAKGQVSEELDETELRGAGRIRPFCPVCGSRMPPCKNNRCAKEQVSEEVDATELGGAGRVKGYCPICAGPMPPCKNNRCAVSADHRPGHPG